MNISTYFVGPIKSISSTGHYARSIAKALIELNFFGSNFKIFSIPDEFKSELELDTGIFSDYLDTDLSKINPNNPKRIPSDIFIQVGNPLQFRALGRAFNIGFTILPESYPLSPNVLMSLNNMDLIFVQSHHAKNLILNSKYQNYNLNGQIIPIIEFYKNLEILFDGIDTKVYGKTASKVSKLTSYLDQLNENFIFLCTGRWGNGDFLEENKNISGLIQTFLMVFANQNNPPALLIKTDSGAMSVVDYENIKYKINLIVNHIKNDAKNAKFPNIYLLYGYFSPSDMNALYNHPSVKCYVNISKGENYCRSIAEAALSRKPIIASNWGGHLDYLDPKYTLLIDGNLAPIHKSAFIHQYHYEKSQWFNVDYQKLGNALFSVWKEYKKYKEKAELQGLKIENEFSYEQMKSSLAKILKNYLSMLMVEEEFRAPDE